VTDAARIRRIEITDFRAFPASQPADIVLDGRNLLAFGENGSGKSSIYRALRELFSLSEQSALVHQNRLCPRPPEPDPRVRVTLTDGLAFDWTKAAHPTGAVYDIARTACFLTHTRLREMNYSAEGPNTPPNLFEYAVETFLADYLTLNTGARGDGRKTVGELWEEVKATQRVGARRTVNYVRAAEDACIRFNEGLNEALNVLQTHAQPLLGRLLSVLAPDKLELIRLEFSATSFDPSVRPKEDGEVSAIRNRRLTPVVAFDGYEPPAHQDFLNEGRQSALAIAICLAARLACVPPGRNRLKLLVLDDLLISLDASHRRPVLKTILELFAEWQIILLTHDRYWFELAREQLQAAGEWRFAEVYERFDAGGLLQPLIRSVPDDAATALLDQAERFLDDNHPAAAANYARSALELKLKKLCAQHRFILPYRAETEPPHTLQFLLDRVKNGLSQTDPATFNALKALKPHKRFVLNPFSHDPAHPVPPADVRAAIQAVRAVP
jgi:energy-coupling factor transporter ATP-binding protein EcfA2